MSNAQMLELDIFPVPLTIVNLGEDSREINKAIIEELELEKTNTKEPPLRSGIGVWQSDFAFETRSKLISEISDMLFELSKPTLKRAGFKGDLNSYLYCTDFWGNINESPYAFNTPHLHGHGQTVFTGVYYPSSGVLDGKHLSDDQDLNQITTIRAGSRPEPGDIVIMDPAGPIKSQVFPYGDYLDRYPYYGLEYCITPKEGTLVLFPHYLMHYVSPTEKTNFKRYSLAFSINYKQL